MPRAHRGRATPLAAALAAAALAGAIGVCVGAGGCRGDAGALPTTPAGRGVAGEQGDGGLALLLDDGTRLPPAAMRAAVKAEGQIVSYAMPDEWANQGGLWRDFGAAWGVRHLDTDMSSVEELQKFAAERRKPVADVGDIGVSFGPLAKALGLCAHYRSAHFAEIPPNLKDPDGCWAVAYYGVIAFVVNRRLVPEAPRRFADLEGPRYRCAVTIDDPRMAAQGLAGVVGAAYAMGGSEHDVQPGVDFFARLVRSGNYKPAKPSLANIQSGEIPIAILWDFVGLAYRDRVGSEQPIEVIIPEDGAVAGPYAAIINRSAPHPAAARALNEWVFSDAGQRSYARGYARPVRKVAPPPEVAARGLPDTQYRSVRFLSDYRALDRAKAVVRAEWGPKVLAQ
ncbi:MAG: extracellular solute-binding protein [Deltaproteobacteria bacterium]|nr:extracellular solute-binding protein [Deltaproteobacteria bacterium]